jgi:glycosyltransferase involved in cell wall biosynthesis
MANQSAFLFDPQSLRKDRPPGISGFMRIRNGEDFLVESIESHIPYYDEVVAVYNACTDRTPQILEELKSRYPDKLKVFHYEPRVHPVGSEDHIRTPDSSVHSIANYYNVSLGLTSYSIATKLDDDHIAIPAEIERVTAAIRAAGCRLNGTMPCFSGINLCEKDGELGIFRDVPFAGNGDHFFFEVTPVNYFTKDKRFERFIRAGLRRTYEGILYWHCKYLKADHGFNNYELAQNPYSRYHKQFKRFMESKSLIPAEELEAQCRAMEARNPILRKLADRFSDKASLRRNRNLLFDAADTRAKLAALSGVSQR